MPAARRRTATRSDVPGDAFGPNRVCRQGVEVLEEDPPTRQGEVGVDARTIDPFARLAS